MVTPITKVEVSTDTLRELLQWIVSHSESRAEGVALLLGVYAAICEHMEPKISREQAAEQAKLSILSLQLGPKDAMITH